MSATVNLPECESDGITVPHTSLQRLPAAFGVKVKFPNGVSQVLQELAPAHFSSPIPSSSLSLLFSGLCPVHQQARFLHTSMSFHRLFRSAACPSSFLHTLAVSVHPPGLSQRVTFSERRALMTLSQPLCHSSLPTSSYLLAVCFLCSTYCSSYPSLCSFSCLLPSSIHGKLVSQGKRLPVVCLAPICSVNISGMKGQVQNLEVLSLCLLQKIFLRGVMV